MSRCLVKGRRDYLHSKRRKIDKEINSSLLFNGPKYIRTARAKETQKKRVGCISSCSSYLAFIQQQAQIALVAQQMAMQKAQQVLAQQAIQKTFGVIATQLPKPGCRVYVG
jgi:hypothetical protein